MDRPCISAKTTKNPCEIVAGTASGRLADATAKCQRCDSGLLLQKAGIRAGNAAVRVARLIVVDRAVCRTSYPASAIAVVVEIRIVKRASRTAVALALL